MKQADVNRLNRAVEHIEAAIVHLEKVKEHVESWQLYRTKQHLDNLKYELQSVNAFASLMEKEPDFQHKDWQ